MNKSLVNSMYRRRMSCPQLVQKLWDAVKVIRYQRQVPNLDRIVRYMQRIYNVNEEEVTRQLGHCVRDGLLMVIKRKGLKGANVGVEQEGYKLPEGVAERDRHDWYCSECHVGGDVIPCGECHRVYHVYCIQNPQSTKHKYQCLTCSGIEEDTDLQDIKQNVLNKLLIMVCTLLGDRYGALLRSSSALSRPVTIGTPGAQIDIATDGESWRIPYFIHKVSDIAKMASSAKQSIYTNLSQFEADCQTIVHNIVIFHGVHSDLADLARQMARDCHTEVKQIRWCYTCYLATGGGKNVKRRKFFKPCHPPHELVYAKESKDAPYWPAKVIREHNDRLDIRFFGGFHFRTTVDRSNTVPITTNVSSLPDFKRTGSWNRAYDELTKHQVFLKKMDEGHYQSSSSSSDSDDSIKSEKSMKSLKSEKSSRSSLPVTPVPPPAAPSATPVVAKRRGRPPGSKNKNSPKKTSPRARKTSTSDEAVSSDDDSDVSYMERTRKKKDVTTPSVSATPLTPAAPPGGVKKKRGRPPANATALVGPDRDSAATASPPKKKRGRPPKKKEEVTPVKRNEVEDEEEEEEEMPRVRTRSPSKRKSVEAAEKRKPPPVPDPPSDDDEEKEDAEDDSNPTREGSVDRAAAVPSPPNTLSPTKSPPVLKNEEEIVSSSCMEPQVRCFGTQTKRTGVEDTRKEKANKELISKLTLEMEEAKAAHADELKQLKEAHSQEICATKKKQWCYNCELEAIYHCCWNTAYCSTDCQQLHWQREHKRVCRRKR